MKSAVVQYNATVYKNCTDACSAGRIHKISHRVGKRPRMPDRPVRVRDHDVGALTNFKRPDGVFPPQRVRSVYCGHFEGFMRTDDRWICARILVTASSQINDPDHINEPADRARIATEDDPHPRIDEFRKLSMRNTTEASEHTGGRAMAHRHIMRSKSRNFLYFDPSHMHKNQVGTEESRAADSAQGALTRSFVWKVRPPDASCKGVHGQ